MRYTVELSGFVDIDADNEFEAEDLVIDFLHSELDNPSEVLADRDIDANFEVVSTAPAI